jgi:PAS domain S-box-containing protein
MASAARAAEFLGVRNVRLSYGSVVALRNITMAVHKAEIHAIVGEHGAGKSSLAQVIGGFQKPDSGSFVLGGKVYGSLTPDIASRHGIQIITQHNPLVDDFSVAENIVIDGKMGVFPLVTSTGQVRTARKFVERLHVAIDPTSLVRDLTRSERALVDILKHLYPDPSLLVLDETLENLSNEYRQRIVAILNERKTQGRSILFVTHRIDDIYNFADRVTILRDGQILTSDSIGNIDKIMLIRLAYTHALTGKQVKSDRDFSEFLRYNEAVLFDLPINLIVVDRENRVKLVNALAKDLFGFKDSGYADTPLRDIFPKENGECLQLIQKATALRRQTSYYHVPLKLKGQDTINTVTVYPIFDGSRLIGNIVIINDITEQERLREQVVLSENLASVGLLAAGVAHEINNPLDIMTYHLENIHFNAKSPSVRNSVKAVEEEISSIAEIVGNLLTFSDKAKKVREEFDIVPLVGDLVRLVAYNARKNGIAVSLHAPRESLPVEANRTEMKQVILNLVKNSFEAMPDGGKLDITIDRKKKKGSDFCSITFDDTGNGIEESTLKDIFLPFFSTKNETGRNAGLGLSICYSILKKSEGSISAQNRAGGGCRFVITLPVTGPVTAAHGSHAGSP